jgi:hypothetical protein
MDLTQYLSATLLLLIITGCWMLFHAARNAIEGYQDELGFHFGPTPLSFSFYSASGSFFHDSVGSTLKAAGKSAKRPRTSGSKPPMLPEGLNIDDLNPQPAPKLKRQIKSISTKQLPSGQTHIPFPSSDNTSDST